MTVVAAPLALHVPEAFTYVYRGSQRASDWTKYTIHAGLYPITFVTRRWMPLPGNTLAEAHVAGEAMADSYAYPVDRTAFSPYYAVAELKGTLVRSYYENQLLWAVSGSVQDHDESATVRWSPYAYEVVPGAGAYAEWVGAGGDLKLIYHATVVERQPCEECREPNCQRTWV